MKTANLLFIQRRPTRAGAQTSLFRLISASKKKTAILCHDEGWLTSVSPNILIKKWPSARSLVARIGGLKYVAHQISKEIDPSVIIANDHQECPFAFALAKKSDVPCITILRSSGMSEQDFEKYKCAQSDHLLVVGEDLKLRVSRWSPTPNSLFREGFLESEFSIPSQLPSSFPEEILVVGSSTPAKGFCDFIEAIRIIEARNPNFSLKRVVFTGEPITAPMPELRSHLEFVGRVDDFINYARQFNFAVHPSRHETFGLAPLELIIAGIPTLCTETGALNDQILPDAWRTKPSSPDQLANSIEEWSDNWKEHQESLERIVENIRRKYSIQDTTDEFFDVVENLISKW